MRSILKAIVLLLLAATLPACAFVDNEVQLEQQDFTGLKPGTGVGRTVYLTLLEDKRIDKTKVGIVKNGFGMETAKVLTKDDPAIWVSNSLKTNMIKAGYQVHTVNKRYQPSGNDILLTGKLTNVRAEPQLGILVPSILARVDTTMQARVNGKVKFRSISGMKEENVMVATGGDTFKGVLNMALQDYMKNFFDWLEEL